ncbi:uncharacterized protein N7473_011603 [Penicillium subrubescens]|uniref:Uncharacterized protein n=1 Tax=Penicillium subrubescens TaxID=1316194 RepID=A0A1Q5TMM4_9EURO|nr:uncharacterized protein N7473_011603 [Penicillium subrubescens]KAJ5880550.1 hypothetical protein N7473_011603 [Penicillium subrubescens]OKP01473.1 hypothetical protein PENSUB_7463 [Penicillium subrubescens]
MFIQTLVVTLFPAIALAVPATQTTSNSEEDASGIFNIPAPIESACIQAIPTAWISSLADPAFASAVLAEEEPGIEPSWYSNEPDSVKEYLTTRSEAIDAYYASASSVYCATATVLDISGTALALCTAGSGADSNSGSIITSTPVSAKASTSSAQLGSTSTGGVPAATAGIAMSLAGTMALLGLAVAL